MAIKVRINGMEIEADSDDELRRVLTVVGSMAPANGTNKPGDDDTITGRMVKLRARLRAPQQVALLDFLAESESGLSDTQLRERLRLPSNNALAGIMAGISKHANAVKLDLTRVLTKAVDRGASGERMYTYRLTTDMKEVVREAKKGARPV